MPAALSADEQARARVDFETSLTQTCTVVIPGGTPVVDDQGGITPGTPTTLTNVPVKRAPLGYQTPEEQRIAERLTLQNPAILVFKYNQQITEQATITMDDGMVLTARGVLPAKSIAISKRVVADEVR